jgi:membrane protein involved in colicin uptake
MFRKIKLATLAAVAAVISFVGRLFHVNVDKVVSDFVKAEAKLKKAAEQARIRKAEAEARIAAANAAAQQARKEARQADEDADRALRIGDRLSTLIA